MAQRTTKSDEWIAARDATLGEAKAGILIGYRNEAELREVLSAAEAQNKVARKTQ